jgi:hypothetical protein
MRQAETEYLQQESRLRGARPRVKAVLFPFDLDYGLAAGSGEFVNTVYGGEAGKLAMEAGYQTSGSWTSPVMHTFSPYLDQVVPSWDDQAGYLEVSVYLRAAASVAAVSTAPYTLVSSGMEVSLSPYFQVKVEFSQAARTWGVDEAADADQFTAFSVDQAPDTGYESQAVDGASTGYLANLQFEGRLTLPEEDILDPGEVRLELARDFSEMRAASLDLVLSNREGKWLAGKNFFFQGLPWEQKELALYHGWELPNGSVEWQSVYRGVLERLEGMAHGRGAKHQVKLACGDWVAARLQPLLGAPTAEGQRSPFMRGFYRAQAELTGNTAPQTGNPVKTGSGSAALEVLGTYRGTYSQSFLVEVQTTGEVGTATFRWSVNQGQSWQESDLTTAGAEDPVELADGLEVYWVSGSGTDLVAGDQWTFTAEPRVYQYQVYGAPFAEITAVYLNGEETTDRVEADAETGVIQVTGRSAQVEARVVKDDCTHPVDIVTDILEEMGLSEAVHQDSFKLAKSLTPECAIGVCFENVSAARAIREIVGRCLYDLWADAGEIKIQAYLGEE